MEPHRHLSRPAVVAHAQVTESWRLIIGVPAIPAMLLLRSQAHPPDWLRERFRRLQLLVRQSH